MNLEEDTTISIPGLIHRWEQDHMMLSYHDHDHPSMKIILGLGMLAVPTLVGYLGRGWFPIIAIAHIVGVEKIGITPTMHGSYDKLNDIIAEWARKNGYSDEQISCFVPK